MADVSQSKKIFPAITEAEFMKEQLRWGFWA